MNCDDIQISGNRPRPGEPSLGGPGAGVKEAAEEGEGPGRGGPGVRLPAEQREPLLLAVPVWVHINKDRH